MPLNPRAEIDVGRAIRRQPFRVRLLVCWAFAAFWIAMGLFVGGTDYWAIGVGACFLIVPFITLAQQRKTGSPSE